ncbi:unnamed protein product [Kuraishia capsulata CBS 1993]|uniref:beta-glucosidase n=1 Tax=Kuraishia capsulata CBS 1993 TaxID=1382522 RepID=W6MV28_9ASCO|nr:uncharacterized protein KUCA_T00005730001 [Kuraishia capsulata CBS 1993]CDK29737.1 unnamed protein product [Kuraishia capsulata CBS 1993]
MEDLVEKLSLDEKISLVSGKSFWYTQDIERLEIPSIRFADGPNGVKASLFWKGLKSACFPCGSAMGATFSKDMLYLAGSLMAEEARSKAVSVILGPGVNIARGPTGGRGFESFSEDPVLSGLLAAAIINGMQDNGIGATLKHLVCNDFEHERNSVNITISQRALREIYLLPFQLAIRDSNPVSLMTSYNKVNGEHVSHSNAILRQIVREEWSYEGTIMSDWTGVYDPIKSFEASLDLEMPGPPKCRHPVLIQHAVDTRVLHQKHLDEAVANVLKLIDYGKKGGVRSTDPESECNNTDKTAKILRNLAGESIVLLKNESSLLPFSITDDIAVIGPNSSVAAFSGGGSAYVNAYYAVSPLQAISNKQGRAPEYTFGCHAAKFLPPLAPLLTNSIGKTGYDIEFYLEPPGTDNRKIIGTMTRSDNVLFIPDYVNEFITPTTPFYYDINAEIKVEESGYYLFGIAVAGIAELYVDGKLVVDNKTDQACGNCFFNMGSKEKTGKCYLQKGEIHQVRVNAGSSHLKRYTTSGVQFVATGIMMGFIRDYDADEEISRAVAIAKSHDKVILCIGLSQDYESEGYDRPDMKLPGRTDELVARVLEANPNTAIVNQSGTPVEMPWIANARCVLQAWYGGNETGNAIADVIFGDVCPSAKLPLTFPHKVEDNPAFLNFRSNKGSCIYGEDVYVGYKYYEKLGRSTMFPFGHGLSYTSFCLSNLTVVLKGETLSVSLEIENTGARDGSEVLQVYIAPHESEILRPTKELKDFVKVHVKAGETKTVSLNTPTKYAFSHFDEHIGKWCCEAGKYSVMVGTSSEGEFLHRMVTIEKTWWWWGL